VKTIPEMAAEAGFEILPNGIFSMESDGGAWDCSEELARFATQVRSQATEQWAAWFRRTGDGSMAGLSCEDYQLALTVWIKDGCALYDAAAKEANATTG